MAARIESLPSQILAGPEIAAPALRRLSTGRPRRLVLFGMGGSAIAGDLPRSVAEGDGAARVPGVGGYAPPAWLPRDDLLVYSSYSGETEETLACFEAPRALGAPGVILTTGGRSPR